MHECHFSETYHWDFLINKLRDYENRISALETKNNDLEKEIKRLNDSE